jgi:tRNA dimethylallyltransferase
LIDVCDPDEEFTVARFQRLASRALALIEARGHRALVVGGTGLYHRAVVDELDLPGRYLIVRSALEAEAREPGGLERLFDRLRTLDPLAASRTTASNERRVVRALEVTLGSGKAFSSFGSGLTHYPDSRFVTIGLSMPKDELARRIGRRLDAQFAAGFLDEAEKLYKRRDSLSRTCRQALGYKELFSYFGGDLSLDEARATIIRRTQTFARRQQAWFRRDPRITWIDGEGPDLLARFSAVASRALPDR